MRESILSSLSLDAIAYRSLDRETLNRLVHVDRPPFSFLQHPPAICISLKEGGDPDSTDLVARSERDRLAFAGGPRVADDRRARPENI